jgi:hypothetical protein
MENTQITTVKEFVSRKLLQTFLRVFADFFIERILFEENFLIKNQIKVQTNGKLFKTFTMKEVENFREY